MRKSFDGLCGIITNQFNQNPTSGKVFIFVNKRRDRIKLLHWEYGGFTLYYKRLEIGTIELPKLNNPSQGTPIEWQELVMIIQGIPLENIKYRKRLNIRIN
jgi:hypothetical protein